jgi:tripartite-type tricarboxylate transporter receptor subunit TctC
MKRVIWLALFCALAPLAPTAAQEPYPNRPLRLIVSVPPGGAGDFTGRLVGSKLADLVGQNVVVENRAGAGGIIASELVAKGSNDGHTLLLSSSTTHGVAPVLYRQLPYDALKDFTHVALVAVFPGMMVVSATVPATTVKELVALAKAKPNAFLFASSGNGSAPQLLGEQFKIVTGAPIVHVPYKGSGPAVLDVASGQVQLMFDGLPSLIGQIKGGRLRPLAALSTKRSTAFPEVPTIAEAGYPGVEGGVWYGISGPAGMPKPVVDRLLKELGRVIAQDDYRDRLALVGANPQLLGPKEYVAFLQTEQAKWGRIIKASGASPD